MNYPVSTTPESSVNAPELAAKDWRSLRAAWGLEGTRAELIGNGGLINTTLRAGPLVLQRINREVFPDAERLILNGVLVGQHLARLRVRGDYPLEVLSTVRTKDGQWWHQIGQDYWRATQHIANSRTFEKVSNDAIAREGARAFAQFIFAMRDFTPPRYIASLPEFHQLSNRIVALEQFARIDPLGRLAKVRVLFDLAERFLPYLHQIEYATSSGELPQRFVHADTKIANILFDSQSPRARAVIDLDTVMTSSVVFDFGDMVRSFCNPLGELANPKSVQLHLGRFQAVADGFMSVLHRELTRQEKLHLIPASIAVTATLGIRFLTDYLAGDMYFRVQQPDDNFQRAAVQLALAVSMEKERRRMERCLRL